MFGPPNPYFPQKSLYPMGKVILSLLLKTSLELHAHIYLQTSRRYSLIIMQNFVFHIFLLPTRMSGKSVDITGNLAVFQKIVLFVFIVRNSQIGNAIGISQFAENFVNSTADRGSG